MSNAYAYSESEYTHAHTHTRAQVGRSYFAELCPAQPHNLPQRQRQTKLKGEDEGGASLIPPLCVRATEGRKGRQAFGVQDTRNLDSLGKERGEMQRTQTHVRPAA